jgi:hypothetical protein
MDRATKQESSIPVQSRVSIVTLAELDKYWESEGYPPRTMSQLIAWSIETFATALKNSGKIEGIESVADAHNYLIGRRLYQNTMLRRGAPKINFALQTESLRADGVDPHEYMKPQYEMRHNEHSVQPTPKGYKNNMERVRWIQVPGYSDVYYPEGDEEQLNKIIKQKQMAGIKSDKELVDEQLERAIADGKNRGVLASEQKTHYVPGHMKKEDCERNEEIIKERDKEELAKLNAPLDPEFIKKNIVRP